MTVNSILDNLESPTSLRAMSFEQLNELAQEIRQRLIDVTSKTGGHLASSLGAVELTLALHRVFDLAHDRLVFDVGHQSYVHKLLTGRACQFDTLRTYGGLSGFPKRKESIYDVHDSGHASDSLSVAAGLALARNLRGGSEHIITLIGDASISGGMAFEALNHIGHTGAPMIVLLNDNEMSISPSVGALSRYLGRARLSKPYIGLRDNVAGGLGQLSRPGRALVRAGNAFKGSFKKLVVPGTMFEEMGFTYIGPIDGHDIAAVEQVLRAAKDAKVPILIHAVTRKGRGYKPAEDAPEIFHGVSCYDPDTGECVKNNNTPTYTKLFGANLLKEAEQDESIVAITSAMTSGTGLDEFAKRYPERFFDVGIAEEHAVTLASGMALAGLRPVVAIYSTFLQRAFDQATVNVALQELPVVFCVDRGGLVGEDGPTHHGALDIAYLRTIPNMRIVVPATAVDMQNCLHMALSNGSNACGPIAIRYSRGSAVELPEVLPQGQDVAILALGRMVKTAVDAAELLAEKGIATGVINAIWAKPIDEAAVNAALSAKLIVTLEDGTISGGFGSAVLEHLAALALGQPDKKYPPVKVLGLPDAFVTHGSIDELFAEVGLNAQQIAETITTALDSSY